MLPHPSPSDRYLRRSHSSSPLSSLIAPSLPFHRILPLLRPACVILSSLLLLLFTALRLPLPVSHTFPLFVISVSSLPKPFLHPPHTFLLSPRAYGPTPSLPPLCPLTLLPLLPPRLSLTYTYTPSLPLLLAPFPLVSSLLRVCSASSPSLSSLDPFPTHAAFPCPYPSLHTSVSAIVLPRLPFVFPSTFTLPPTPHILPSSTSHAPSLPLSFHATILPHPLTC
ncbi:hypothetical protein B0H11DRAFT_857612 [Mycena galericulata]|nr:hypothetical protein B0H11DRAFT_857612 [Mycena galericulata]